jgi:glycine oxidase
MPATSSSGHAIIIGGGIIGLFTARRLHQAGYSVEIFEKASCGRAASWAGGGILSPLYPWRAPKAVWQMAAESLRVYPGIAQELAEKTGIDPQWNPCGMLAVNASDADAAVRWGSGVGLPVGVGTAQIGGGRQAVLSLPWVANIRNPRLLKALVAEARGQQTLIHEHCAVTGWHHNGGRVTQVLTSDGESRSADVVVLCAGAWTGRWAARQGWALPVQPIKGQMLLLNGPPGLLKQIILHDNQYLIPRKDGRILVGSTVEDTGFDDSLTQCAHDQLLAFARQCLPVETTLTVEAHWAGLRPGVNSELPFIERHPDLCNVWVNAGHHRNGITLAPAAAERLLSLIPT